MIYNLHCNSCVSSFSASWLLHTSVCRTAPSCIKWFSIPTRHCLSSLGSWCQIQLAKPLVGWLRLCTDLLYTVPAIDWFCFGRVEKYLFFWFFFFILVGVPPPPPFFILFQFLLDVLGKMEPPTSSRLNSRKRRKDGSGPNGATELDGIPPKMSRRSLVSKQR